MTPDFVYQLAIGLLFAGAVYGGIRSDLRSMKDQIKGVSDAARRAHERLDFHLEKKVGQ